MLPVFYYHDDYIITESRNQRNFLFFHFNYTLFIIFYTFS